MRVALLGASGFVGSAVFSALVEAGLQVDVVQAPRLLAHGPDLDALGAQVPVPGSSGLATDLEGIDVVVNCAGLATPSSPSTPELMGANALLPAVVARAASGAGVRRVVHVSSAAVQGRVDVLDEGDGMQPFSPYSMSKALGEAALLREATDTDLEVVRYRPTSVHGGDRALTRSLVEFARGPLASVAGAGDRPTPQVLVEDVASAVSTLVTTVRPLPSGPVLHPAHGMTTARLMRLLGQREPHHVPDPLARSVIRVASRLPGARVRNTARRLEMLWFGQPQRATSLVEMGFVPQVDDARWRRLATHIVHGSQISPLDSDRERSTPQ